MARGTKHLTEGFHENELLLMVQNEKFAHTFSFVRPRNEGTALKALVLTNLRTSSYRAARRFAYVGIFTRIEKDGVARR